jgi:hypothetical protein
MEDIDAETERPLELADEIGFQLAARDLETIRDDDVRFGGHAPDYAGHEGAMPAVGRDSGDAVRVRYRGRIPILHGPVGIGRARHARQPGVVGIGVFQQSGIGDVDQDPGAAVLQADRGVGLDVEVHLFGLGGRAGAGRGGGEDVIG